MYIRLAWASSNPTISAACIGTEWNAATARAIGRRLPALLEARRIVVGTGRAPFLGGIFRELTLGIAEAGCDVFDIGLCDTPAVYFATAHYDMDGSVMITASHNPPEYNGLKVSRRLAVPVGYDTGLAELEKQVMQDLAAEPRIRCGVPQGAPDGLPANARYPRRLRGAPRAVPLRPFPPADRHRLLQRHGRASSCTMPCGAPAGISAFIFDEPDGRFPNHAPNPLIEENLAALKKRVVEEKADIGICFDGDADRVMFVDETGRFISPDLLIGLLGTYYFRRHPERLAGGSRTVTYDVRSSRSVVEFLQALGAAPDHLPAWGTPSQRSCCATPRASWGASWRGITISGRTISATRA